MFKLIVLSLLLLPVANIARAGESHSALKIAVVDIQKFEENALAVRDLARKIQIKEEQIKTKLAEKKKDIDVKYQDLSDSKKQSVLTKEVFDKKLKDLEMEFYGLQVEEKVSMQSLELAKMHALQEVQNGIKYSTSKISKDNDLVVPSNSVLYFNNKTVEDITFEVIKSFNENIKQVDFDKFYDIAFSDTMKQVKGAGNKDQKSSEDKKKKK